MAETGSGSEEAAAPPAVKSARRALELLEHLDRVQRPQTLTEIAESLAYPRSSTLALLKSLHGQGYLSYALENRSYAPTMKVAMLGAWVQRWLFRDGLLISLMEDLLAETGETIILGLQNDLQVQYVHVVQSLQSLRYHLHPGTLRPIHRTAAGLMLLAPQPREAVARLVRQMNARGEGDSVTFAGLWRELDEVRGQGYAWTFNRVTEGAGTLAMLTPKQAEGSNTVVGIAGPIARLAPKLPVLVERMQRLIVKYTPPG